MELLAERALSGDVELAGDAAGSCSRPASSLRAERVSRTRASRSPTSSASTVKETDISILEASTGFRYNAKDAYTRTSNDQDRYVQRFSAIVRDRLAYFQGRVSAPAGRAQPGHHRQPGRAIHLHARRADHHPAMGHAVSDRVRTRAELGLFAQDQWTLQRLTLNLGLRFDYFNGYVPAQHVAGRTLRRRPRLAAVHDVPNWTDLNPRLGGAYDLFGDGRTAVKASIGRYVGKMRTDRRHGEQSLQTSINSVNRSWSDANGDYVPDCDLHNFNGNGECGPISNRQLRPAQPERRQQYADDLIRGLGTRDYLWDLSAEVQHQLTPRCR